MIHQPDSCSAPVARQSVDPYSVDMTKPLNPKQTKFAQLVASGIPASTAYLAVGYQVSKKNAEGAGSRLSGNVKVKALISEIRAAADDSGIKGARLSIEETRKFLASIVRTPIGEIGPDSPLCAAYSSTKVGGGTRVLTRVKCHDKLRAIELDSKLAGHFAPEQLVVETGPETLASIKERVASVCSGLNLAKLRRMKSTPAIA